MNKKIQKNAIVTLAIGTSPIWKITHPLMKNYANKIGCDFVKIEDLAITTQEIKLKKFGIYHLLESYYRILYLDGDVAINPGCPDLFKIVPYNKVGAVRERKPFYNNRCRTLKFYCKEYEVNYPYATDQECIWINIGVLVVSKCHKALFDKPKKLKIRGWVDMPIIDVLFIKHKLELYESRLKYN